MTNNYKIKFAIIASISWSLAAISAALSFNAGASILLLLFVRFLTTFIVSFVVDLNNKKTNRINNSIEKPYFRIFIISIFSTLFISSYMSAIDFLPISIAVSVVYTFPILTFFANSFIKSRSIDLISTIALFASLFGIWLLSGANLDGWNNWGVLLALTAAISQVIVNIASRHESIKPGWELLKYIMALPAIFFTLLFFMNDYKINDLALIWCLASSLGMIGGCYFFYHSIANIGPVRTSNIMYLEPVFTIAIGVLFLNNVIGFEQWIGIVVIVFATYSLELWGKKYQ